GRGAQRRADRGSADQSQAHSGQEKSGINLRQTWRVGMRKFLTAGMAACAVTASVGLAAAQMAPATPKIDQLPDAIKPSGMAVFLEVPATGSQVYACGKNQAGAWAWNFKAPDAELFDTSKNKIGKHYAGPTWEGNDGGKVVAAAKGKAPAPDGKRVSGLPPA